MGNTVSFIREFKAGNNNCFELIADKMKPSIEKYSRLLYKDNREDAYAELVLAMWEAVVKMEYFDDEGKCITYLNNAIRNKYMELYRKSRKKHDHENAIEDEYFDNTGIVESAYNNIILREDMLKFGEKYSGIKKQIFFQIVFKNMSDTEIAKECSVSRQYVNRLRNKIYTVLKQEYFI